VGLPDCAGCPVRQAVDSFTEENFGLFNFYMRYLSDAVVNPFPMAEEPVVMLDMGAVRLALDAERVPVADWPKVIDAMRALHSARWGK
jgi:hypothetical protein